MTDKLKANSNKYKYKWEYDPYADMIENSEAPSRYPAYKNEQQDDAAERELAKHFEYSRSYDTNVIRKLTESQFKKPGRVSLSLLPLSALITIAECMVDGAIKRSPHNWRKCELSLRERVDATLRHILAWLDGEDTTSDSGLSNLASAAANLLIVIDKINSGNYVDDRLPHGVSGRLIERYREQNDNPQNR